MVYERQDKNIYTLPRFDPRTILFGDLEFRVDDALLLLMLAVQFLQELLGLFHSSISALIRYVQPVLFVLQFFDFVLEQAGNQSLIVEVLVEYYYPSYEYDDSLP